MTMRLLDADIMVDIRVPVGRKLTEPVVGNCSRRGYIRRARPTTWQVHALEQIYRVL